MFISTLTETEIIKVISFLLAKLFSGHDLLNLKLFKAVINSSFKPLYLKFNKSISFGQFPTF